MTESVHTGHVVVVDRAGQVVAAWGDPESEFFLRSAAKPFQAAVSQSCGADLSLRQTAVASASHGGEPVHVAIVDGMLAGVGLGREHLLCPPDRPLYPPAARAVPGPEPVLHNCSGKHAAMLRACAASGWDLAYVDTEHPLQQLVADTIADVTGVDTSPVGVDGCGVPTFRTTVAGMARAYARLATDPVFAEVARAMHRYPGLTAGSGRPESAIAVALNAAVKGGAKGCLGVAMLGQFAVAVKADDGLMEPAAVAAIEVLGRRGVVPAAAGGELERHASPIVLGGGRPVGSWEPVLA